jgi:EmrB/QacA subfamily drug resistance transporter
MRSKLALGLLCCAFFIDVMGSTSVFTASPALENGLGLTQTGLQWSLTAATLPAGALLLAGGRLADQYGRRRMFMAGLAMLASSSLACGLAPDAVSLIAARGGQGVSSALLMPAALSLVVGTFPEQRDRNRALAAWSAIGGIGATAGLLLGGLVTAGLGWQWVFLVNVPAGLAMLALCPLLLAEPGTRSASRRIDVPGTLTFSAGIGVLIYGISQVPALGWADWRTSGLGAAGVALLAAFARTERTSTHPIVPPRLLRARAVVAGNLTLIVAGMCVDGLLFTLTLYTQQARGYTPLQFGAVTTIMTLSSIGASWVAQRGVSRLGARPVSVAGLALLGATCGLFATVTLLGGQLALLLMGMAVFGVAMGCAFVGGSVASLQDVPKQDSGVAAAIQNISFSIGTTLGVAVLATVTTAIAPHATALASRGAFLAGAGIAALGAVAVLALRIRRPTATPRVAAPAADGVPTT